MNRQMRHHQRVFTEVCEAESDCISKPNFSAYIQLPHNLQTEPDNRALCDDMMNPKAYVMLQKVNKKLCSKKHGAF